MIDSSLSSLGAKVVVVASNDENHPPENIIDGWVLASFNVISYFWNNANSFDNYKSLQWKMFALSTEPKPIWSMLAFDCCLLITFTQKHQNILDVHRDVSTRVHHSLRWIHADFCCYSGQLQRYVSYNSIIRTVIVSEVVWENKQIICPEVPKSIV